MSNTLNGKSVNVAFRNTVLVTGGAIYLIGLLALIGWFSGLLVLGSISPNFIPMAPDTATIFMLFGIVFIIQADKPVTGVSKTLATASAAFIVIYGLLKFVEYFIGLDLTFENTLFPVTEKLGAFPLRRMSPITGAAFALSGTALALILQRGVYQTARNSAAILGVVITVTGFVTLMGYLFDTPFFYGGSVIPLAPTTAFGLAFLGAGLVVCAGPGNVIIRQFTGPSVRARLLRVFLPLTVTVIVLEGWIHEVLDKVFGVTLALVAALFVLGSIVVVGGVVFLIARVISREIDNAEAERRKAEQLLAESEQKYRSIFYESRDGIVLIDPDTGRMVDANPEFERQTGRTVEQLRQLTIWDIRPPDQVEAARQILPLIRKKGEATISDLGYLRPDGVYVPIEANAKMVTIDGRKYVQGVTRDVTVRKKMEEMLKLSEQNFRSSLENQAIGCRIFDEQGNLSYANPAVAKLYGFNSVEELANSSKKNRLTPESYRESQTRSRNAIGGVPLPSQYELEIVRKDGQIRNLEAYTNQVIWDGKRQYQISYVDVTERKRSEERLRASESFSGSLLRNAPNPVLVTAMDSSIQYVNPAFEAITGYSRSETVGLKAPYPWWPSEMSAQFTAEDRPESGIELHRHERCYRRKNGEPFWIVTNIRNVRDMDDQVTLISNWQDITERKAAEEKARQVEILTEYDKLRSELMANVSHELRTPLAAIKGFTTSLLQTDVKWSAEQQRDFLQTIDAEADHLALIISDLLDASRLEAGKMTMDMQQRYVSDIVVSIGPRLAMLAKQHRLELEIAEGLPPVSVDIVRTAQVISNLVENATKFSAPGTQITIAAQRRGDKVVVSVTDQGEGIDPDALEKLFNRFYQTRSIAQGKTKGTGLGLFICRGIIEAQGGQIWVESKLGEGAKFSFTLPTKEPG